MHPRPVAWSWLPALTRAHGRHVRLHSGRSFGRDTKGSNNEPHELPIKIPEHAPDDDLKRRREERRVHKAMADVGDGHELDRDHGDGDSGRGPEIWNEKGRRGTQPAERGHNPAHGPATHRGP